MNAYEDLLGAASAQHPLADVVPVAPPTTGMYGRSAADPFDGKSIEEVIAFCRASGIRKLSYKGVEIEFSANPSGGSLSAEALQKFAADMAGAVPSDAEMLGWSAPDGFPSDLTELAMLLGAGGAGPAPTKE